MRLTKPFAPLLFLLCLFAGRAASALTVCVADTATLANALGAFNTAPDGTTLTIKLVKGTYAIGSTLGAVYYSSYPESVGLKLLGGYTAGCASRTVDPTNTVIDGLGQSGARMGVTVHGDADLLIEGVTFTRLVGGDANQAALSLGLDVDTSDTSTIEIRYSRFVNNTAAKVVYVSGAQMRFVDNLVAHNTVQPGSDSAAVHAMYSYGADSMLVATNNTIADNSGPGLRVGTSINSDSSRLSEIADNILRGNGTADLSLGQFATASNPLLVYQNMIGTTTGYMPDATNLASDPRFVDPVGGNYRLQSNSPAINSGAFLQLWGFPAHDIAGGTRIVGSRIDRGAYESPIDDSTTAIVSTTADNGNDTSPTPGSLRAAIKAANAATGPYTIRFNIAGGCPRLLSLAAPMLDVTGDVTVDGTSQAGWTPNTRYGAFDANLCFYVNGAANPNTPWALHVPASAPANARLVVRGIGFAGFNDAAIKLGGGRGHSIAGNQFGAVPFTPANASAIRVTGNSGPAFIGGYDDESAVNLIAGSSAAGIQLDNTAGGSVVANNVIGFVPDGLSGSPNANGVFVFNSKNNAIQYNYIGNNLSSGVILSGSGSNGNRVQYNVIGMAYDGSPSGNGSAGVLVSFAARNNTIGAPLNATWGGNFIVASSGPGVWISPSGGTGNSVLDNEFVSNGGLDIDLAAAGPSANQATNPATGPNALQNYPVLTSAARDFAHGIEVVTGTLDSAPNTTYRLDLYYGATCSANAAGRGLALYPLMRTAVTTGALGNVPFTASVPFGWGDLPLGAISATVTDPAGNTSELGNCVHEGDDDAIFEDGFEAPH
ncbi:MAG: choice-of-anchor Q domain-containing protein [Dokdonella sp.]|uniref:choice-of-anchor Q domain-containing protein n=1 Tax=Dokdonella sp. TaxID=2291710 RepID=UPI003F7FBD3F